MYKSKDKSYFIIALSYWVITMIGFLLMGILYRNNVPYYNVIYYILFIVCIFIVLLKDKHINNLGFTGEKIKINLVISISLVLITFLLSIFISNYSLKQLWKGTFYYLFYVSMIEEIIYRGFLQNYLFGLKANKYFLFSIGAFFFSFMHLPFQMYVNHNVTLNYIIEALPQLLFCVVLHFGLCYLTYKRKDITIPIALHYAIDYIQAVL